MLGRALDVQMDANRHLLGHVAPADEMHGEAFDRHRDDAAGRNVQLGMLQRSLVVIVVYRYRVRKLAKKEEKKEPLDTDKSESSGEKKNTPARCWSVQLEWNILIDDNRSDVSLLGPGTVIIAGTDTRSREYKLIFNI